jgi:hypothetical protein
MNKQADSHEEIDNCKEMALKPMSFFFRQGSTDAGKKILTSGESLAKNIGIIGAQKETLRNMIA